MFHACKPNWIMEGGTTRRGQWRWGGGINEVGVELALNEPEDALLSSSQHGVRCSAFIKHGEAEVHKEHAQRSKKASWSEWKLVGNTLGLYGVEVCVPGETTALADGSADMAGKLTEESTTMAGKPTEISAAMAAESAVVVAEFSAVEGDWGVAEEAAGDPTKVT